MMSDLYNYNLLTIFLVSAAVVLGCSEIGRRLGVRSTDRSGKNVSTLESAILALLALMIGFTFAMALSRFEGRREAVLNEANAIGTTALRARLLPPPHRAEALELLQEYVKIRIDITERPPSLETMNTAITRSNEIHEALWQQVKAVAKTDTGMVPTGLFIQTLNELIDDHEKRLTAARNRVPNIVLIALYGLAAVASGFTGYASGIEARRSRLPVYITGVLLCSVILLIQDLDRPGAGFITISQQPMIDTAASIAGFVD
jgi:uncharacterized membrane protein YidH (DUF202 family)